MEDINSRFYTCLWEQRRMRRAFNYTKIAFGEEDEVKKEEMFPERRDYVFNITEIVSDELSLAWYGCTRMGVDSYDWTIKYLKLFDDSEIVYSYPVSLMQTMLSQIIYLT